MTNRFAGVQRFQQRQLFVVLFHQCRQLEQRRLALRRSRARPVAPLKHLAGGADRQVNIYAASPGHLSQLSLTGRILHGKGFAFGRLLIAAIDKQSVLNIQGLRPVLPILQVVEVHTLLR
ncbi:hypothetical protein D3C71_1768640 [compost metagenome]